jgi:hypothetical protein
MENSSERPDTVGVTLHHSLGVGIVEPTGGFGERLDVSGTDLRAFDVISYTLIPEPGTGLLFSASLFILRSCRFRLKRS